MLRVSIDAPAMGTLASRSSVLPYKPGSPGANLNHSCGSKLPLMPNVRLIARLDIKAPNLIKGVHLEGLRKIGDPQQHARAYYVAGADEIIYMDIVASLYNRNSLSDIVRYTAEHVFIPITVGGGIRSLADVENALRCGADK